MVASEIADRAKPLLETGGFLFIKSPELAGTADFFLVAADPPSEASSQRNMVVCAYQCKNWDSKNRPDVDKAVDTTSETIKALKALPSLVEFNLIPHFVLVYDHPLQCDARVKKGMHMVQISREMGRRNTSQFKNLFIFPKPE